MAQTPEGKVKDEIRAYLDSLRPLCWYYCPVPTGFGVRGIPDIVGVFKGAFFGIEVKSETGRVSGWQKIIGLKIKNAGGIWVVARDAETVKNALQPSA